MKLNSTKDKDSMLVIRHTEIKSSGMDKKKWFRLWMWIGGKLGWIKRFMVLRDYSMVESCELLEKAYNDIGGDKKWGKDLAKMN